ncbi:hypothetical protein KAJ27_17590 [bacterium]|nr:hypothetical protein [bacterium]
MLIKNKAFILSTFILVVFISIFATLTMDLSKKNEIIELDIDVYLLTISAESIASIASSSIQEAKKNGNFTERWYKKLDDRKIDLIKSSNGYTGKIEGKYKFCGQNNKNVAVKYTVVVEDIPEMQKKEGIEIKDFSKEKLNYYRTDIFVNVCFNDQSKTLYYPITLQPEEKIYAQGSGLPR